MKQFKVKLKYEIEIEVDVQAFGERGLDRKIDDLIEIGWEDLVTQNETKGILTGVDVEEMV